MGALSIKITGTPAAFDPPVQHADAGDVISWDNQTAQLHQVLQTAADGSPVSLPLGADLWAVIEPGDESPAWTVPASATSGTTITYMCIRHGETGTIFVN
jgi:plastocyanin